MVKTTLVIMAAGIGSRFGGGIKQLEPVGPNGEFIIDYSIYDAIKNLYMENYSQSQSAQGDWLIALDNSFISNFNLVHRYL